MDIFDQVHSEAQGLLSKASQLVSGARLTAGQAVDRIKEAPAATSAIGEGLRGIGIDARPPDAWEVESTLRSAKDRLTGIWRGYIAPALRR